MKTKQFEKGDLVLIHNRKLAIVHGYSCAGGLLMEYDFNEYIITYHDRINLIEKGAFK